MFDVIVTVIVVGDDPAERDTVKTFTFGTSTLGVPDDPSYRPSSSTRFPLTTFSVTVQGTFEFAPSGCVCSVSVESVAPAAGAVIAEAVRTLCTSRRYAVSTCDIASVVVVTYVLVRAAPASIPATATDSSATTDTARSSSIRLIPRRLRTTLSRQKDITPHR